MSIVWHTVLEGLSSVHSYGMYKVSQLSRELKEKKEVRHRVPNKNMDFHTVQVTHKTKPQSIISYMHCLISNRERLGPGFVFFWTEVGSMCSRTLLYILVLQENECKSQQNRKKET